MDDCFLSQGCTTPARNFLSTASMRVSLLSFIAFSYRIVYLSSFSLPSLASSESPSAPCLNGQVSLPSPVMEMKRVEALSGNGMLRITRWADDTLPG